MLSGWLRFSAHAKEEIAIARETGQAAAGSPRPARWLRSRSVLRRSPPARRLAFPSAQIFPESARPGRSGSKRGKAPSITMASKSITEMAEPMARLRLSVACSIQASKVAPRPLQASGDCLSIEGSLPSSFKRFSRMRDRSAANEALGEVLELSRSQALKSSRKSLHTQRVPGRGCRREQRPLQLRSRKRQ